MEQTNNLSEPTEPTEVLPASAERKRLTLRLGFVLRQRVELAAIAESMTLSNYIRHVLREKTNDAIHGNR